MSTRPHAVAFDVLETLFSLEPLRPLLRAAGLPGEVLELWFSQIQRTGFALAASNTFRPFKDIARATLEVQLVSHGQSVRQEAIEVVVQGFAQLQPYEDVEPGLRHLQGEGIRVLAVTNGSADNTSKLFHKAGLEQYVERIVSIDDVQHWKPRREVYLHAAQAAGVAPGRMMLVAAHAWDIHGAKQAGLMGAWLQRREKLFLPILHAPDVSGASLPEVVQRLSALPG